MIVVDTSVWIDHSRAPEPALVDGLAKREVLIHEFVVGELALGTMPDRARTMRFLNGIARVPTMPTEMVAEAIERIRLFGAGIGYVDTHILVSTLAVANGRLWTRDKRLASVADRFGINAEIE